MSRTRARRPAPRPAETAVPPAAGASRAPQVSRRALAVLALFVALFVWLQVHSFTQKSGTFDEPLHLAAGFAALRHGDHRVDPTHPPFMRMWAALPLLALDPALDLSPIDRASPLEWPQQATGFGRAFLYVDNDADRLLHAGRAMVLVWAVVLGVLIFCWTQEWLGCLPAVVALGLFTVSPNLSAHGSLVTTDLGATCFIFGSAYFLWRTSRRPHAWNIAAFLVFSALAVVTKFSGVLILPIAGVLLCVATLRRSGGLTRGQAAAVTVLLAATTYTAIWMVYGFRYAPGESDSWLFRLHTTAMVEGRGGTLTATIAWVDRHRLLPNAFAQGFAFAMASASELPAFLATSYRSGGWWYYFPIAVLIKTPLSILLLATAGMIALVARRKLFGAGDVAFVLVPMAVVLGAAVATPINIGLRHVLPLYPFALLAAAAAAKSMVRARLAWQAALAIACAGAIVEFAGVYPHNLTFFNLLVGGPRHGGEYLADSNVDWGQDLKLLKHWMDREGAGHVNLAYFGTADPSYYGIECTRLPGAALFDPSNVSPPRLPGYVAISETVLSGVYLPPRWRLHYRPLQSVRPVARIGNSIRVYWLERWPDIPDATLARLDDPDILRRLADSLLRRQWYTRASRYYARYLSRRPDHPGALGNYGVALMALGRKGEGIAAFRRAVDLAPGDARARVNLTLALLEAGAIDEAVANARRGAQLNPEDRVARNLLDRALAARPRAGRTRGLASPPARPRDPESSI